MEREVLNPPAVVRSAEDLATLLHQADAEHEAGDECTRKGLEHYRKTGTLLAQAKAAAGHGNWLGALTKTKIPQQRASECMRLAAGWDKLPLGGNFSLREALRIIAGKDNADEDLEALAEKIHQHHDGALASFRDSVVLQRRLGRILRQIREKANDQEWENCLAEFGISAKDAEVLLRAADDHEELSREVLERRHSAFLRQVLHAVGVNPPYDDEGEPAPQRTALRHGFRLVVQGSHREYGIGVVEFDEHPDHPGYWVWAFVYDNAAFAEYQSRGAKMEGRLTPDFVLASNQFTPDVGGWEESPVKAGSVPLALEFDRMDKEDGRGRWSWLKRQAVEMHDEPQTGAIDETKIVSSHSLFPDDTSAK